MMPNENARTGWKFDNSYTGLPESLYSKVVPDIVSAPELVIFNTKLAESMGIDGSAMRGQRGVAELAGNAVPEGAEPIAQAYAGHQFGHFTMLGDGRALLLGEHITPSGARLDIALKGSGRTPYSRSGDGRAALGPMLREYIISEAMHGLGIPTTRSLAVTATGEPVYRETELPGAILTRVASSHIRVGTFQYAAWRGELDVLRQLADYTWNRHYADASSGGGASAGAGASASAGVSTDAGIGTGKGDDADAGASAGVSTDAVTSAGAGTGVDEAGNRYLSLLRETLKRQAALIAKWQLVGFIHGVMNTDNMALSGETIDYGPCAFMDVYKPSTVFSSIDSQGRYAYSNQPGIGLWNLTRLAEALLPLLHEEQEEAVKLAEGVLETFADEFHRHWYGGMRAKLGLAQEREGDESLIRDLLALMEEHGADYTNTFLALTYDRTEGDNLYRSEEFEGWRQRWLARLATEDQSEEAAKELMRASNPAVIPRNHRVEEALEAAVERGDYSVIKRLLKALEQPYAHTSEQEEYKNAPTPSAYPYRTFCGT